MEPQLNAARGVRRL